MARGKFLILLDTCTLLWLATDQGKLSDTARGVLSKHPAEIYVSAISAFELGIKYEKKLLRLPHKPTLWFEKVIEWHGLLEIPVDHKIAARSAELPKHHHDPCDRMIIATALEYGFKILSPDRHFSPYREIECVW